MNRFVLFYHQVVREAKPGRFLFRSSMTLDRFRTTMTWIKDRFHPLGMEEMAPFPVEDQGRNHLRARDRAQIPA